jgi:uncharacterized protein
MEIRRVIYKETQSQFFKDVNDKSIFGKMFDTAEKFNIHPSGYEQLSWLHNAPKIKELLEKSDVKDTYVTFEFLVPYNMKRIDCMIYGSNQFDKGYVVHIELKQWTNSMVSEANIDYNFIETQSKLTKEDFQSLVDGYGNRPIRALTGGRYQDVAHPSQQVCGYDGYLKGFIEVLSTDQIGIEGLAYCYNYLHHPSSKASTALYDPKYNNLLKEYRTYSEDDIDDLAKELHNVLCNGNGLSVFNKMINSPIRPSKKLIEEASSMIDEGNVGAFSLIEDQIIAKNVILDKIKNHHGNKSVIIVKGGPGTGKTVIALNIMAILASDKSRKPQWNFRYATKSKPLLEGVKHQLSSKGGARLFFSNMVQFIPANSSENSFDVLLVDEAHRLTRSANMQFTTADKRTDMPQIDTLIRCAKTSVFFIDDKQVIRSLEIGSTELIRAAAKKFNATVDEVSLKSQFRCNGSNNYLDWVDELLYNNPIISSFTKDEFDFKIFDDPQTLYNTIVQKNQLDNTTARLTAGFCWKWSSELDEKGDLVKDVRIGEFAIPWETKGDVKRDGYPYWYEWAYLPNGIKQCGCIYTAQGFEFDYIGVIIGKDLYYDESEKMIKTNIKESCDPTLKKSGVKVDDYIRNIYRVLMTRGMKGCYVYICDDSLREHFKKVLGIGLKQGGGV